MAETESNISQTRWRDKKQIAAHFGISVRHATNLMQRRILPYSKVGRSVRFHLDRCEAAMVALEVKSVLLRDF